MTFHFTRNAACLVLALFCFGIGRANAQATDNPYRTRYPSAVAHWTDSLPWQNVTNVSQFGALPDDGIDDSAAIATGIASLSAQGGGVLAFAAGTYNLSGNVTLKPGVVLRGVAPAPGLTNKQPGWAPLTKLVFPKYIFDTSANGGAGTANSTAFKQINGTVDCSNAGLVYLDVNRADILFKPDFNATPGAPYTTPQPVQHNRNLIFFGLRCNNAARPDAGVPATGMRPWQRYSYRFVYNIGVTAWANVVVAGCRLNDSVTDNFEMPGYLIKNRANPPALIPLTAAQHPLFDYTAHYAISVNRGKASVTHATPDVEPLFFRPGMEILDNWIYKTSRVGVIASGLGLRIKSNIFRDDSTKPNREIFTGPTGTVTPVGANTYENRGIDFSGWQVKIDSNDVIAYRNKISAYLSTDGEGILCQECCGGTSVNDYVITDNVARNYIGIFYMQDINNVLIARNHLSGVGILVNANTNNNAYVLNSTVIQDNTGVTDITSTGSRGGQGCIVERNQGTGNTPITVSCNVLVRPSNTGIGTVTYKGIDPADPLPGRATVAGPCASDPAAPGVLIAVPRVDTLIYGPVLSTLSIPYRVRLTAGNPDSARASVLLGTDVVGTATFDPIDSNFTFNVTIPPTREEVTLAYSLRVASQGYVATSQVVTLRVRIVGVAPALQKLSLKASPQPVAAGSLLRLDGLSETPTRLTLADAQGRVVANPTWADGRVSIPSISAGLYVLFVETPVGVGRLRLAVE